MCRPYYYIKIFLIVSLTGGGCAPLCDDSPIFHVFASLSPSPSLEGAGALRRGILHSEKLLSKEVTIEYV